VLQVNIIFLKCEKHIKSIEKVKNIFHHLLYQQLPNYSSESYWKKRQSYITMLLGPFGGSGSLCSNVE
jgi:hypothetical protein